jgi:hypothetical protein
MSKEKLTVLLCGNMVEEIEKQKTKTFQEPEH